MRKVVDGGMRSSGMLRSPVSTSTGQYTKNLDCKWLLKSDGPLKLTFTMIDIEPSANCTYDSIQIVDTRNQSNVQTICGTSPETQQIVTKGDTLIRFRTDASNEAKGFKLRYKRWRERGGDEVASVPTPRKKAENMVEAGFPYKTTAQSRYDDGTGEKNSVKQSLEYTQSIIGQEPVMVTRQPVAPTCNMTILVTNHGGIIHSYQSPSTALYLPNQDCYLVLKSSVPLRLTFVGILHLQDPGPDGICRSDGLVIYNASFSLRDRPKTTNHIFCGHTDCNTYCNSLFSDGDTMIRFVSDDSQQFRGFSLRFEWAAFPNKQKQNLLSPTADTYNVFRDDDQRQIIQWGDARFDLGISNAAAMSSGVVLSAQLHYISTIFVFLFASIISQQTNNGKQME